MKEARNIILYHGSNIEVANPLLIKSRRKLDFGPGFYLTSDYDQAQKWALRASRLRGCGTALVSVFEFDTSLADALAIRKFNSSNAEWLRYVVANRTQDLVAEDYDIVYGPVANDQTIRTINDYIRGRFPEEIAIQLLLPQKLKDQYAFKSETALEALRFKEALP